jgi:hypothetical protein
MDIEAEKLKLENPYAEKEVYPDQSDHPSIWYN